MLACRWLFRDSRGIQTHNLLIRSQMLYSVELGSLIPVKRVQRYVLFSKPPNIFHNFFKKVLDLWEISEESDLLPL